MMNLPLGDTAAVRIVGSITDNSGWLQRMVIANGAVPVDPGVYPDVSRPSNFNTAPLQEDLGGVNTTTVDSIRAAILWKPVDSLAIDPTVMYQRTELGAAPVVNVNGASTHPLMPLVKGHWEPSDVPEPQYDSFTFGSLKAVGAAALFLSDVRDWALAPQRDPSPGRHGGSQLRIWHPCVQRLGGGTRPLGPEPNGPGATEQDTEWQLSKELRLTSTAPGPLQWVAGYFTRICIPSLINT